MPNPAQVTSAKPPRAGDIVLIPFPFTDLSQHKQRPALLVTNPDADGDFIAAAVTSRAGHDGSVALTHHDLAHGTLAVASHIRADKLFTFHLSLVRKNIATVKPAVVSRTLAVLCPLLGCDH